MSLNKYAGLFLNPEGKILTINADGHAVDHALYGVDKNRRWRSELPYAKEVLACMLGIDYRDLEARNLVVPQGDQFLFEEEDGYKTYRVPVSGLLHGEPPYNGEWRFWGKIKDQWFGNLLVWVEDGIAHYYPPDSEEQYCALVGWFDGFWKKDR